MYGQGICLAIKGPFWQPRDTFFSWDQFLWTTGGSVLINSWAVAVSSTVCSPYEFFPSPAWECCSLFLPRGWNCLWELKVLYLALLGALNRSRISFLERNIPGSSDMVWGSRRGSMGSPRQQQQGTLQVAPGLCQCWGHPGGAFLKGAPRISVKEGIKASLKCFLEKSLSF